MPETVGGLYIKSIEFTRSWGIEPASASGVGLAAAGESTAGISVGDYYALTFGGVVFYGIMSAVVASEERESGREYNFSMVDNRVRLQWALVFGQWNMAEDPNLIHAEDYPIMPAATGHQGGVGDGVDFGAGLGPEPAVSASALEPGSVTRGRIYGHIPPSQWGSQFQSYTVEPLSAQQILDQAFRGAIGGYQFTLNQHSAQNKPVYNVDANSGMTLAALVAQITEAQGLQVTLDGQKTLRWDRRGGTLIIPSAAHLNRDGYSVSSEPTKVRIVGDRVLLQVNNIELEPDWKPAWQAFMSEAAWLAEVKRVSAAVPAGSGGHAEIAARAREITVRQYITLAAVPLADWADYGRWGKVSRMNIPAWVYINAIVFRSYRIPQETLLAGWPMRRLEIHDSLLCAVRLTGEGESTTIQYRTDPVEFYPQESAYVIARGQPLDLLSAADRDTITRLRTKDLRTQWSEVSDFTLDPVNHSIRFASPVFTDGDPDDGKSILAFPNQGQNGYEDLSSALADTSDYLRVCVPNPDYEITAATVRCTLVFRLGKFYKDFGTGARWTPYSAGNLAEHLLHSDGGSISHESVADYDGVLRVPTALSGLREILYENGRSAVEEAEEAAEGIVVRDGVEQEGSYTRYGAFGTSLTGPVDRVTIIVSGIQDGIREVVDFAKPRPTRGFVSAREIAQRFRSEALYDGQEDLRREVRQLQALARLERLDVNDRPRSTSHSVIADVFRRPIGGESPAVTTLADPNSQWPEDRTNSEEQPITGWRAGDIVWLDDAGLPSRTGGTFGGIVVTDSPLVADTPVKFITVATAGTVPCACAPGLIANSSLAATPGDWKCTTGGTYPIGMLAHSSAVPGTGVATLAFVRLGAGGGGGGAAVIPPLYFVSVKPAYVPEPTEPVASGFTRFFLTWGTTQGVLADNWFNCVDIPATPETLRHVAMKAFLSPTAEDVVVTNCEWITFTEEQRLTTPYQTPEFGSDGSRPEFLIIPMGQLYISAEGAPLAGNNGGGSFLIREHVASIKFESGAATYQKSINAERLVY